MLGSLKSYGFDKPEFNPALYRVKPERAQDPLEEIAKALVAGYKGYEGVQDAEQKRRLTDATITYKKEYGDDAMGLAKFKAGAASDLAKQKAEASIKLAQTRADLAQRIKQLGIDNDPETQKFLSGVLATMSDEDVALTEEDKAAVGYLMSSKSPQEAQSYANIFNGSQSLSKAGKAYLESLHLNMNRLNLYNKAPGGSPESAQFKEPLAGTPIAKAPTVSAPAATATAPKITPFKTQYATNASGLTIMTKDGVNWTDLQGKPYGVK